MQSRGVRVSDMLAAIKEPDSLYSDVEYGTLIAIIKFNGNSIVVAYKLENNRLKLLRSFTLLNLKN